MTESRKIMEPARLWFHGRPEVKCRHAHYRIEWCPEQMCKDEVELRFENAQLRQRVAELEKRLELLQGEFASQRRGDCSDCTETTARRLAGFRRIGEYCCYYCRGWFCSDHAHDHFDDHDKGQQKKITALESQASKQVDVYRLHIQQLESQLQAMQEALSQAPTHSGMEELRRQLRTVGKELDSTVVEIGKLQEQLQQRTIELNSVATLSKEEHDNLRKRLQSAQELSSHMICLQTERLLRKQLSISQINLVASERLRALVTEEQSNVKIALVSLVNLYPNIGLEEILEGL